MLVNDTNFRRSDIDIEDRLVEILNSYPEVLRYYWGLLYLKELKKKGKGSKIQEVIDKLNDKIKNKTIVYSFDTSVVADLLFDYYSTYKHVSPYLDVNIPALLNYRFGYILDNLYAYITSSRFNRHLYEMFVSLPSGAAKVIVAVAVVALNTIVSTLTNSYPQDEQVEIFEKVVRVVDYFVSLVFSYPLLRLFSWDRTLLEGTEKMQDGIRKIEYNPSVVVRMFEKLGVEVEVSGGGEYFVLRPRVKEEPAGGEDERVSLSSLVFPEVGGGRRRRRSSFFRYVRLFYRREKWEKINLEKISEQILYNLSFYSLLILSLILIIEIEGDDGGVTSSFIVSAVDKFFGVFAQIVAMGYLSKETLFSDKTGFINYSSEHLIPQPVFQKLVRLANNLISASRVVEYLFGALRTVTDLISGRLFSDFRPFLVGFVAPFKRAILDEVMTPVGINYELMRSVALGNPSTRIPDKLLSIATDDTLMDTQFFNVPKVMVVQGASEQSTDVSHRIQQYLGRKPWLYGVYSVERQSVRDAIFQNILIHTPLTDILTPLITLKSHQKHNINIYFFDADKLKSLIGPTAYQYFTDNYSINLFGSAARIKFVENRKVVELDFSMLHPFVVSPVDIGSWVEGIVEGDGWKTKITKLRINFDALNGDFKDYCQTFVYLVSQSFLLYYNLNKGKDLTKKATDRILLTSGLIYATSFPILNGIYTIEFISKRLWDEFYGLFDDRGGSYDEAGVVEGTLVDNIVYRQNPVYYRRVLGGGDVEGVKRHFIIKNYSVSVESNPGSLVLFRLVVPVRNGSGRSERELFVRVPLVYNVRMSLQEVFVGVS